MTEIKINVYRSAGAWYGSLWINGEYDSCDELPCDSDASESEAIECAQSMPLSHAGDRGDRGDRVVKCVADVA